MQVNFEEIAQKPFVRKAMDDIMTARRQAAEYQRIKMKLGLSEDATYTDVSAQIDDLIEIAQMVAEMGT